MTATAPVHRPARLSATGAVLLAVFALGLLAQTTYARVALVVEAAGLLLFAIGAARRSRTDGHGITGSLLLVAGTVVVLSAIGGLFLVERRLSFLIEPIPGMVGLLFLAMGVAPPGGTGSRSFVKAGTGLVFLSIIVAGLFWRPVWTLVVAGAATIVAWDVGEQSINVGEQLGRAADTRRIEAAHGTAGALVGCLAVGVGIAITRSTPFVISYPRLVLVLAATVALLLALHR